MTKVASQKQVTVHRWQLARIITLLSIIGITIVAGLVVIYAENKATASQTVLTAVLPLLAAWVSTVLAYYYSSESIEAATQSVKELMSVEEKLETILVADRMIKSHELVCFSYSDDLKVQDMLDKLKAAGKGYRFPFLGKGNQPALMLHKSAVDDALVERTLQGDSIAGMTLKDLFEKNSDLKKLAETSFGVIVEDATLADAKAEMDRVEGAQDVFVTTRGSKDDAVVGLITNRIIDKCSRI